MTQFETIILCIIYLFCYGFTLAMFINEKNVWLRVLFVIVSFTYAFYAPVTLGGMLYDKLNGNNNGNK